MCRELEIVKVEAGSFQGLGPLIRVLGFRVWGSFMDKICCLNLNANKLQSFSSSVLSLFFFWLQARKTKYQVISENVNLGNFPADNISILLLL